MPERSSGSKICSRPQFDWHRPRFALTFDDDWITHYERALPVLQDLGVTRHILPVRTRRFTGSVRCGSRDWTI